jgi:signal transduction histidine kinase/CheY-like chemotaxis protein
MLTMFFVRKGRDHVAGGSYDTEFERLARDLAEAIEQQRATSQVLAAIGEPSLELGPVFDTVVKHAVRLCRADSGMIWRRDGDVYRQVSAVGGPDRYRAMLAAKTIACATGTTAAREIGMVGLVGLERRTVTIDDARTDPRYEWPEAIKLGQQRSMLGVPMLVRDQVLGVIVLNRFNVDPFDERTIGLATTFATQGAIAIQNVQLVQELEQRGGDLARSVDELRVMGEISQAVGSSLDVVEVLTTIVHRAVELSQAEGGSIFEYDAESQLFEVRAVYGTDRGLIERIRRHRVTLADTFVGRTAASGRPQQCADLLQQQADPHIEELRSAGWRSLLVVPLLRESEIIGALAVRRRRVGAFSEQSASLLETLANQSAIAIHNARVYRQLEEKTRQLEVASEHKSEFLAGMSHELRTPLNAVIGFSDVLLERMFGDINPRQEEYLNDIRNAGRHLLELINEILDLSKVEAGRMELDLGAVSIPSVIEQTLAMVRERATEHRIGIELDVADDVGTVNGDEVKLTQVILNLISNAVKFTGDGGSVAISSRVVGDEVHVVVRDTGSGIPESDRERIFEAFQRGGRSPRQTTEGTGLGLTLSKRIVNLHGGRMWMTSQVGVGSTFGFSIPVGRVSGLHLARAEEPPHNGRATILIVEDDPQSADLLSIYLEGLDVDVTVARDGVEGLDLARRHTPTAVILDIRLPRLGGWDLLALLKADPDTAAIPVVIVSMLDERGKGVALGAAEYLVKPVSRSEVAGALRRVLPTAARGTVVVIDGDTDELNLIEATLSPEGYRVLCATDEDDGIAIVKREQPAVVLIDLMMPGIDGFAALNRLRSDAATAHVPVVFLGPKDIASGDRERFAGQIGHLAEAGVLGQTELVSLVDRLMRQTAPEKGSER